MAWKEVRQEITRRSEQCDVSHRCDLRARAAVLGDLLTYRDAMSQLEDLCEDKGSVQH